TSSRWRTSFTSWVRIRRGGNSDRGETVFTDVVAVLLALMIASAPVHADRVLIQKSARQLTLLRNGKALRTYRVNLGSNPVGTKDRQGDGRTPEGVYRIDRRNASSKY